MKQTTKDWLTAAEDDLLASKILKSDARYPGDLGLLPHGKPTISEIEDFINFCESIKFRITKQLG